MPRFSGPVAIPQQDAPPAQAGRVVLYAKNDGKIYAKEPGGAEHDLTLTGPLNAVTTNTPGLDINVQAEPPASPSVDDLWLDSDATAGIGMVYSSAPVVVSPTNPGLTEPGLWIQTFENGDFTFWVEDGT